MTTPAHHLQDRIHPTGPFVHERDGRWSIRRLFGIGVDRLETLDDIAFRGYLAGLADAGWRGDPRQIRLAYAVASSMRFGLPVVIDLLDEDSDPWMEGVFGRRIDEIVPRWIALRRFLFRLADEARALIHDVG